MASKKLQQSLNWNLILVLLLVVLLIRTLILPSTSLSLGRRLRRRNGQAAKGELPALVPVVVSSVVVVI